MPSCRVNLKVEKLDCHLDSVEMSNHCSITHVSITSFSDLGSVHSAMRWNNERNTMDLILYLYIYIYTFFLSLLIEFLRCFKSLSKNSQPLRCVLQFSRVPFFLPSPNTLLQNRGINIEGKREKEEGMGRSESDTSLLFLLSAYLRQQTSW